MPPNPLSRLAGVCGSAHIWILLVNLLSVGATGGILWGSLTVKIDDLRRDIERERGAQLAWNAENQRQFDVLRERENTLHQQIFELLKEMRR
jgi:hypothetical protein